MMSWKQEAVELVEAALTRLQTVATRPDPEPDPEPVNELYRLVHTMQWFALSLHDSTRDLIHELQLFVDDLRMGRVSLGPCRAILLREALRLIKVDLDEASLLRRRPSYERARVVARDLNALRSGKPITAATSGSQPSNEASDEITSESGDCPAAVPHARGHT